MFPANPTPNPDPNPNPIPNPTLTQTLPPTLTQVRMFPALVSCTTIDWFTDWPADALKEVATKFLEEVQIEEAHLDGVATAL